MNYLSLLIRNTVLHDIAGRSAEIAFKFVFSIVPGLIFISSLFSVLNNKPESIATLFSYFSILLHEELSLVLNDLISKTISLQSFGIITAGVVISIWAASSGFISLIKGLENAYHSRKRRHFIAVRFHAMMLLVGTSFLLILSFNLIIVSTESLQLIFQYFNDDSLLATVYNLLRWPLAVGFLFSGSVFLYYFGPVVKHELTHVLPGSIFFTGSWSLATWILGIMFKSAGFITETFGVIGSSILLMLWLYITAYILLLGGEINAIVFKKK